MIKCRPDSVQTSTIPKSMEKILVTFNDKFGWCRYTPDHILHNSIVSCVDCSKMFYGLNSVLSLTLHKILFHEEDDEIG